jgi:hypothetical protein
MIKHAYGWRQLAFGLGSPIREYPGKHVGCCVRVVAVYQGFRLPRVGERLDTPAPSTIQEALPFRAGYFTVSRYDNSR